MKKFLVFVFGLVAVSAFAGWNGSGVPSGTGNGNIHDTANWTGGIIDGDFSTITQSGTTTLLLADNITFANGTPVIMTATFTSGTTSMVLPSTAGLSVGQVVSGVGIRYNTVLVGFSGGTTAILSQATYAASSGNYTFIRQALNFNFGVFTSRATNVLVAFASDSPGTARTVTLSGRVLQTQMTPSASPNAVTFSSDIAFALTDQTYITRETGAISSGTAQPRMTINGPFDLGSSSGIQRLLLAGGDLTMTGVVSGVNSLINVGAATEAGKLTLTHLDNSYSGGNTTFGYGSPIADSTRVLANTGMNSALGSAGNIGLDNIKLTLQGFSTPQITDRSWNVGGVGGASLDNNGAAPVVLTGDMRNDLVSYSFFLGGTYQNYGTPNVLSGNLSDGSALLGFWASRGVWLLNNDNNTYTGSVNVGGGADGATIQFTSVADMGVASALGSGTTLNLGDSGIGNIANYFEYVGTKTVTANRVVKLFGTVSGANNAILANGLGALELSGAISNSLTVGSGTLLRYLYLGGTGSGTLSGQGALGDVTSGANKSRVAIIKYGSGTWTFSGSNFDYQGGTDIRSGNLILDYTSAAQLAAATPGTVRPDGGTLTFKGKPTGTTSDTLPVLQLGSGGTTKYHSSTVVLDANNGAGFNLTVNQLEGDVLTQKFDLIDLSSNAGNAVAVNALGLNLKAVNGSLMNNAATASNGRSVLVVHTPTQYGFAALSDGTSGTLEPLSGQTALPTSGYANTANYILNTASTVTPSATLLFSTLTINTSAGAPTITVDSPKEIKPAGSGRGVLVYGSNDATLNGGGSITAGSIWFHNYLDSNATLYVGVNISTGSTILWGGPGFTVYSGTGLGLFFSLGGGVFRMTTPQTVSVAQEFAIQNDSVFEIGADLNGATAGDFTYALGTGNGKFSLYGNSGLSAAGANRVVNFGGAGATLTWGSNGFLTYTHAILVDGGYALKLSSPYSDATLEIQNPIDLNGNSTHGRRRTVEVANGSAVVDARLSGTLSGNAAFVKRGAGTVEVTGAQTYEGPLMVMEGTLRVGAGSSFANTIAVQLRGGGIAVGSGANALGVLELDANSVIDVGDGSASLAFADSSACVWSGTLTINGHLEFGSLRFGTDANGLTPAQIALINNRGIPVFLDVDGYLRRAPVSTVLVVR